MRNIQSVIRIKQEDKFKEMDDYVKDGLRSLHKHIFNDYGHKTYSTEMTERVSKPSVFRGTSPTIPKHFQHIGIEGCVIGLATKDYLSFYLTNEGARKVISVLQQGLRESDE